MTHVREPSRRPVFYLIGCAGLGNYGDDAIARAWIHTIQARHPDAEIVLDCYDVAHARELHPGHTHVEHAWTFVREHFRIQHLPWRAKPRYTSKVNRYLDAISSQLPKRIDKLHIVGGGYLNDIWRKNYGLLNFASALAARQGIRPTASGLSLNPISPKSIDRLSTLVPHEFAQFDLRDPLESVNDQELAWSRHASQTGDDLFHFFQQSPPTYIEDRSHPVLHICAHTEKTGQACPVNDLLRVLSEHGKTFLQQHPNGRIVCHEFYPGSDLRQLTGLEITTHHPFSSIWQQGIGVNTQDRFVTTRFHFSMALGLAGIEGVNILWSDYYRQKFDALERHQRFGHPLIDLRLGQVACRSSSSETRPPPGVSDKQNLIDAVLAVDLSH